MNYDYSFFKKHAEKRRNLRCPSVAYVGSALVDFFDGDLLEMENYEILIPADERMAHQRRVPRNPIVAHGHPRLHQHRAGHCPGIDHLAAIAAGHHVIDRPGILKSRLPRHG
ncbi:hypothetical protein [Luteolibacter sp.]|uniref:hypothetical protein n=1 Tax=Luteolibacter sp. TaxID=1962973 RepID=UPI003266AF03